jgi:adenosylhomocysteine nucleosidase
VLILAAMAEELEPLCRRIEPGPTGDAAPGVVRRGRLGTQPVIVACTGEGRTRASAAALTLLARFDPRLVVVVGIAGGLSPDVRPGGLVVAAEVRDGGEPIPPPDDRWIRRALRAGNVVAGIAVSASRILCTPAEKAAVRADLPAGRPATVDLESAAVARAAAARGVPYLVLRVVCDASDEELPLDLNRCRDRLGGIRRLAVVGRALVHPSSVRGLWRLRRRVASCAGELARGVQALLEGAEA